MSFQFEIETRINMLCDDCGDGDGLVMVSDLNHYHHHNHNHEYNILYANSFCQKLNL